MAGNMWAIRDPWANSFQNMANLLFELGFGQDADWPPEPLQDTYRRILTNLNSQMLTLSAADTQQVLRGPYVDRRTSFVHLYIVVSAWQCQAAELDERLRVLSDRLHDKVVHLLRKYSSNLMMRDMEMMVSFLKEG